MRRLVLIAFSALLLVSLLFKSRTNQEIPDCAAFKILTSSRVIVKINGDVMHPGVYEAPANIMAGGVINMAIPLRQLKEVKPYLTSPLFNGQFLSLVIMPDGSGLLKSADIAVNERLILGIPLDITSMNESDFDSLAGVGSALARRIVEYRHNNGGILSVSDLLKIEGIGQRRYYTLRKYFQPAINTR